MLILLSEGIENQKYRYYDAVSGFTFLLINQLRIDVINRFFKQIIRNLPIIKHKKMVEIIC